MMLFLMRHGTAAPGGGAMQDDGERPLTLAGKIQVQAVAEGIKRQALSLDAVISSPLVRAQQTARVVADVLGLAPPETSPSLAPGGSPAGLRTLLQTHAKEQGLLLVGHHPDVTLWIAFFTGMDASLCPQFGTASVAALQVDSGKKKAAFLWFQTSEQLSQA